MGRKNSHGLCGMHGPWQGKREGREEEERNDVARLG
jgi:hypothetical protein